MTKIIAIANQKGGVAKSTTAEGLAVSLSNKNYKVLLIDWDPQGNLTTGMGISDQDELDNTITELIINTSYDLPSNKLDYILNIKDNLDLIPANIKLANIDNENSIGKEHLLKESIMPFKDDYDFIIIDCCPSLGFLTKNALTCADSVLIPTAPEYYSAKGLELLLATIMKVKQRFNQNLSIEGILYTRVDPRLRLFKINRTMINEAYGKHLHIYSDWIPQSTEVGLSMVEHGKSIMLRDIDNPVVDAYKKVTNEILERNGK